MLAIKGYIFDYGGTLDTGGNHWGKVLWHAYQRCRVPATEEQFRQAYVYAERLLGSKRLIEPHFSFRETMACKLHHQFDFLSRQGLVFHDSQGMGSCGRQGMQRTPLYYQLLDDVCLLARRHTQQSADVLQQLSDKGMPMVLVSNFYGNIHNILEENGLRHFFKDVIESAVVGIRKPDPRIFSLGVQALGLNAEEVVVVGDSLEKDIMPAHAAGCRTVWLKGEQWDGHSMHPTACEPDYTITILKDLLMLKVSDDGRL